MPLANGIGHGAVAHEHRVYRGAQEALDQQRRRLIRGDEVGERTDDGSRPELLALLEHTGSGRRESNALAFQCLERVHFALKCRVCFVHTEQLRARGRFLRTRFAILGARLLKRLLRRGEHLTRPFDGDGRRLELAPDECDGIAEQRAFFLESGGPLRRLVQLASYALAVELHAARAIVELAQSAVGLLDLLTCRRDGGPRLLLAALADGQSITRGDELTVQALALCHGILVVRGEPSSIRLALVCFGLGALTAGER